MRDTFHNNVLSYINFTSHMFVSMNIINWDGRYFFLWSNDRTVFDNDEPTNIYYCGLPYLFFIVRYLCILEIATISLTQKRPLLIAFLKFISFWSTNELRQRSLTQAVMSIYIEN